MTDVEERQLRNELAQLRRENAAMRRRYASLKDKPFISITAERGDRPRVYRVMTDFHEAPEGRGSVRASRVLRGAFDTLNRSLGAQGVEVEAD